METDELAVSNIEEEEEDSAWAWFLAACGVVCAVCIAFAGPYVISFIQIISMIHSFAE